MLERVEIPEGQRGHWTVQRFDVSKENEKLEAMRAMFGGRGRYTPAGTYTRLMRGGTLVMSDTPDEMRDHFEPVLRAQGHVLINGLGIGMVLRAVLRKPGVTAVTVVELSPEVVELVGAHYVNPRLQIVCASAFDYTPPKGVRYGVVWHDIWDHITGDNVPEMTRLKRKYGLRADWQGCCCEWRCRHRSR